MKTTSSDDTDAHPNKPSGSEWSADELIPFGKYILLNKINSGATAAVYRAKIRGEAGFERLVAIKRILPHMAGDPEFVNTFVREAKTAARLNHTNICPIYELGKVGESLYMAMEWIAGKDLGAITRRLHRMGEVMPPVIAAYVAAKLCDALDYAHSLKDARGQPAGIIHRDLSPTNIVISYEGGVKLIDFGLAKAAGRAQQTNVDALKQKLGYMSPELVKGKAPDARSDIFGVGVCLYEMVTARRLFVGKDDMATLKMVSNASVPPPSALVEDAPEELEQIIMHALEREPDARWQHAAEMGQALMQFIAMSEPRWTARAVGDFMIKHFSKEMAADQKRVNELLEASHDTRVLEERRKFFASPAGAAAMAKAEAVRRMSTMPPGVFAEAAAKPASSAAAAKDAQALKTPALPRVAVAAGIPPAMPKLGAPLGRVAPPLVPPKLPGTLSGAAAPPPPKAAGMIAPPRATGGKAPPPAPVFEDEPTNFFDSAHGAPAPAPSGIAAATDEEIDEATAFFDSATAAKKAEADLGQGAKAPAAVSGSARGSDPGRKNDPNRKSAPQPKAPPAVASGSMDLDDEKTEFLVGGEELAEVDDRQAPVALPGGAVLPDVKGFEEEEATHIFFNKDDGTGIPELMAEEPVPAPAAPRPSYQTVRVSPEALIPQTSAETPAAPRSKTGEIPAAPRSKTGEIPAAPRSKTGEIPAPRSKTGETPAVPRAKRKHAATLQMRAVQPRRDRLSTLLLVLGLAMLAIAIVGLVLRTPLGVTLGIRKANIGAIEVRTTPYVEATVKLDGVFRGRAPLRMDGVRAGTRHLELEANGYNPVVRDIELVAGGTAMIDISLTKK